MASCACDDPGDYDESSMHSPWGMPPDDPTMSSASSQCDTLNTSFDQTTVRETSKSMSQDQTVDTYYDNSVHATRSSLDVTTAASSYSLVSADHEYNWTRSEDAPTIETTDSYYNNETYSGDIVMQDTTYTRETIDTREAHEDDTTLLEAESRDSFVSVSSWDQPGAIEGCCQNLCFPEPSLEPEMYTRSTKRARLPRSRRRAPPSFDSQESMAFSDDPQDEKTTSPVDAVTPDSKKEVAHTENSDAQVFYDTAVKDNNDSSKETTGKLSTPTTPSKRRGTGKLLGKRFKKSIPPSLRQKFSTSKRGASGGAKSTVSSDSPLTRLPVKTVQPPSLVKMTAESTLSRDKEPGMEIIMELKSSPTDCFKEESADAKIEAHDEGLGGDVVVESSPEATVQGEESIVSTVSVLSAPLEAFEVGTEGSIERVDKGTRTGELVGTVDSRNVSAPKVSPAEAMKESTSAAPDFNEKDSSTKQDLVASQSIRMSSSTVADDTAPTQALASVEQTSTMLTDDDNTPSTSCGEDKVDENLNDFLPIETVSTGPVSLKASASVAASLASLFADDDRVVVDVTQESTPSPETKPSFQNNISECKSTLSAPLEAFEVDSRGSIHRFNKNPETRPETLTTPRPSEKLTPLDSKKPSSITRRSYSALDSTTSDQSGRVGESTPTGKKSKGIGFGKAFRRSTPLAGGILSHKSPRAIDKANSAIIVDSIQASSASYESDVVRAIDAEDVTESSATRIIQSDVVSNPSAPNNTSSATDSCKSDVEAISDEKIVPPELDPAPAVDAVRSSASMASAPSEAFEVDNQGTIQRFDKNSGDVGQNLSNESSTLATLGGKSDKFSKSLSFVKAFRKSMSHSNVSRASTRNNKGLSSDSLTSGVSNADNCATDVDPASPQEATTTDTVSACEIITGPLDSGFSFSTTYANNANCDAVSDLKSLPSQSEAAPVVSTIASTVSSPLEAFEVNQEGDIQRFDKTSGNVQNCALESVDHSSMQQVSNSDVSSSRGVEGDTTEKASKGISVGKAVRRSVSFAGGIIPYKSSRGTKRIHSGSEDYSAASTVPRNKSISNEVDPVIVEEISVPRQMHGCEGSSNPSDTDATPASAHSSTACSEADPGQNDSLTVSESTPVVATIPECASSLSAPLEAYEVNPEGSVRRFQKGTGGIAQESAEIVKIDKTETGEKLSKGRTFGKALRRSLSIAGGVIPHGSSKSTQQMSLSSDSRSKTPSMDTKGYDTGEEDHATPLESTESPSKQPSSHTLPSSSIDLESEMVVQSNVSSKRFGVDTVNVEETSNKHLEDSSCHDIQTHEECLVVAPVAAKHESFGSSAMIASSSRRSEQTKNDSQSMYNSSTNSIVQTNTSGTCVSDYSLQPIENGLEYRSCATSYLNILSNGPTEQPSCPSSVPAESDIVNEQDNDGSDKKKAEGDAGREMLVAVDDHIATERDSTEPDATEQLGVTTPMEREKVWIGKRLGKAFSRSLLPSPRAKHAEPKALLDTPESRQDDQNSFPNVDESIDTKPAPPDDTRSVTRSTSFAEESTSDGIEITFSKVDDQSLTMETPIDGSVQSPVSTSPTPEQEETAGTNGEERVDNSGPSTTQLEIEPSLEDSIERSLSTRKRKTPKSSTRNLSFGTKAIGKAIGVVSMKRRAHFRKSESVKTSDVALHEADTTRTIHASDDDVADGDCIEAIPKERQHESTTNRTIENVGHGMLVTPALTTVIGGYSSDSSSRRSVSKDEPSGTLPALPKEVDTAPDDKSTQGDAAPLEASEEPTSSQARINSLRISSTPSLEEKPYETKLRQQITHPPSVRASAKLQEDVKTKEPNCNVPINPPALSKDCPDDIPMPEPEDSKADETDAISLPEPQDSEVNDIETSLVLSRKLLRTRVSSVILEPPQMVDSNEPDEDERKARRKNMSESVARRANELLGLRSRQMSALSTPRKDKNGSSAAPTMNERKLKSPRDDSRRSNIGFNGERSGEANNESKATDQPLETNNQNEPFSPRETSRHSEGDSGGDKSDKKAESKRKTKSSASPLPVTNDRGESKQPKSTTKCPKSSAKHERKAVDSGKVRKERDHTSSKGETGTASKDRHRAQRGSNHLLKAPDQSSAPVLNSIATSWFRTDAKEASVSKEKPPETKASTNDTKPKSRETSTGDTINKPVKETLLFHHLPQPPQSKFEKLSSMLSRSSSRQVSKPAPVLTREKPKTKEVANGKPPRHTPQSTKRPETPRQQGEKQSSSHSKPKGGQPVSKRGGKNTLASTKESAKTEEAADEKNPRHEQSTKSRQGTLDQLGERRSSSRSKPKHSHTVPELVAKDKPVLARKESAKSTGGQTEKPAKQVLRTKRQETSDKRREKRASSSTGLPQKKAKAVSRSTSKQATSKTDKILAKEDRKTQEGPCDKPSRHEQSSRSDRKKASVSCSAPERPGKDTKIPTKRSETTKAETTGKHPRSERKAKLRETSRSPGEKSLPPTKPQPNQSGEASRSATKQSGKAKPVIPKENEKVKEGVNGDTSKGEDTGKPQETPNKSAEKRSTSNTKPLLRKVKVKTQETEISKKDARKVKNESVTVVLYSHGSAAPPRKQRKQRRKASKTKKPTKSSTPLETIHSLASAESDFF